ncbi:MAG: flagellar filament capping protein FliD [Chloroflexota bacterium]
MSTSPVSSTQPNNASIFSTQGPISFGGLVSGLNTQAVIQGLLAGAQAPLKLLQSEQAGEQAKLVAWQDLMNKVQALQADASTLSLQATIGAKKLTFGGASGTFATGTASSSAVNGSFQLQIDQLASNTTATSTGSIGTPVVGTDTVVGDFKTGTSITAGTFTVDGHQVSITTGETFSALFSDISTQTGGSVSASLVGDQIQLTSASSITLGSGGDTSNFLAVTKLAGQPSGTTITSGPVGVANATAVLDSGNINGLTSTPSGSINVNGVTINYNTTTDTLNDVLDRVNSSAAGVTATYSPNSDTVTFTSSQTGNTDISLADTSGNLLASLKVTSSSAHTLGNSAKYEVNNGPAQYSLTNTVNSIQPGVNLTFQGTTGGAPITVTVGQDTSTAEKAINTLVTDYNTVQSTIAQYTAYDSVTNTAGLLLGDPTVEGLQAQLNNGLFIANGSSLGLASGFQDVGSIGLNTGPIGSAPGTTNSVQFSTTTFESAMSSNPAAVSNLVTTVFGSFNKMAMGLTAPGGQIDNAIQSENSLIQSYQTDINNQNLIVQQQQNFLNQEFTSMETMLAQIQSQSGAGASALAGLNSSAAPAQSSTSALLG